MVRSLGLTVCGVCVGRVGVLGDLMGTLFKSMGTGLVGMLDKPETVDQICAMAKRLDPSLIRSLGSMAGLPLGEETVDWIHRKLSDPQVLRTWITFGKRAHSTYSASRRTWATIQPLFRPLRVLVTYLLLVQWAVSCLWVA